MANYYQGTFTPKNPEKYVGDVSKIIFRSSWEQKFMIWVDNNKSIIKWNSEEIIIPYISPIDNLPHRYFPDFTLLCRQTNGGTQKVIVEIKPLSQTREPKKPKRMTPRFLSEVKTWAVNNAKWDAAKLYAAKLNMQFVILTERELGIK